MACPPSPSKEHKRNTKSDCHRPIPEKAVLLSRFPRAALIRIDPGDATVIAPPLLEKGWEEERATAERLFVGLQCGGLEGLTRIMAALERRGDLSRYEAERRKREVAEELSAAKEQAKAASDRVVELEQELQKIGGETII